MENTAAQPVREPTQKVSTAATIWGMASSILINGVLPFAIYWILTHATNISDFLALVASGVPSLIASIVGIIRSKRIDFLSGIVLAGIAISLIIIALGGTPRVYLIRESFFTVAFGLAYLISLFLPRPLMFYFSRYFATGNHAKNMPWFDSLWQYQGFRTSMRVMTAVWGIGFLLEAGIRIYLVLILSTEQFLLLSPFVIYGTIGMLIVWTFFYSRQGRKRSQELQQQMAVQQHATTSPNGE